MDFTSNPIPPGRDDSIVLNGTMVPNPSVALQLPSEPNPILLPVWSQSFGTPAEPAPASGQGGNDDNFDDRTFMWGMLFVIVYFALGGKR